VHASQCWACAEQQHCQRCQAAITAYHWPPLLQSYMRCTGTTLVCAILFLLEANALRNGESHSTKEPTFVLAAVNIRIGQVLGVRNVEW
jgi:uncharacterized paraquat-inducible protein A